uniref:Uncharacterized protein n=1 Tax=Timema tahoe TaxID=61484 RepID=A0A7R9FH06_9NEOP|nr:unnamed protein product [Timema tahoe]
MKGAKLVSPLRHLHFICHLDGESSNLAVTLLLQLSFLNQSGFICYCERPKMDLPKNNSDSNNINFSLCSCHLLSLRELAIYLKLT